MGLDDGADFEQQSFDALFGWLDQELALVLTDILPQEIKAFFDVSQLCFLDRQFQPALGQEGFYYGLNVSF